MSRSDRPATISLANGLLRTVNAKTTHALVRSTARFRMVGVIDEADAGRDAGEVIDGRARGILVFANVEAALDSLAPADRPTVCVVGVATGGGVLPPALRSSVEVALRHGMTVVNGLHQLLCDDSELVRLSAAHGGELIDIRKPPPVRSLRFWTGAIARVQATRIAVLGTDCAIGKRTTALMLRDACRAAGVSAEMIYTGQTGWLQGMSHGLILDATPNDFVSGELERAVVECDEEKAPQVMFIEGQSSLRNPSGPCGAELILSTGAHGVVMQHPPGRRTFLDNGLGSPIPSVESEIALVEHYGVPVLAVALNTENLTLEEARAERDRLQTAIGRPVVLPLEDGVHAIVDIIRETARARPRAGGADT